MGSPVAYFSAEYALSDPGPAYAGGLGVLAGDFVNAASDTQFPLICVGLHYGSSAPTEGLTPVTSAQGEPIVVTVPIQDHNVFVTAWKKQVGSIPIYFLDTNISLNQISDQKITEALYAPDKEVRLKQEMVLGIGGTRFLHALGIHPALYHANEGHSGLLAFELIAHEMEHHQIDFQTAVKMAQRRLVFTNHTLVPAGDEVFSNDLVSTLLTKYSQDTQIPVTDLVALGLIKDSSLFSLTMLCLRMSCTANAVSRLHATKAKETWTEHPMIQITNGIYIPRWDKLHTEDPKEIWSQHQKNKQLLLDHIQKITGVTWSPDVLLAGWARRLVSYKRPLTALEDIQSLLTLARSDTPIRIVFSGKIPEHDSESHKYLEQIQNLSQNELRDILVFLPGYDLNVAQLLTAGCDIWLNTPTVGFEACGTSGMKAALNGVLPVSTRDGWVDEVDLYGSGWVLDSTQTSQDLISQLRERILPMYQDRPTWISHMISSRKMILDSFDMQKVVQKYIDLMYLPSLNKR